MNIYGLFRESSAEFDSKVLTQLRTEGYAVIENLLNQQELKVLLEMTDNFLSIQEKESTEHHIDLKKINEENLLRCPLFYHRNFYELLCLNPAIMNLTRSLLGDNYQLHLQNAVINKSETKHHQATWHRDFPYQPFLTSRPMALSVFFCLTDFTERTGGTYIVPESHLWADDKINLDLLESKKLAPEVKAGGAIIFDSLLWHRSGQNISGENRYGINNVFTTPILKQQIALPGFLPQGYCQSETDQKILGYKWAEPKSVLDLRQKRNS